MLAWIVSLLFLPAHNDRAAGVTAVDLDGSGSRYLAVAEDPYPHPAEPADTDGAGKGTPPPSDPPPPPPGCSGCAPGGRRRFLKT